MMRWSLITIAAAVAIVHAKELVTGGYRVPLAKRRQQALETGVYGLVPAESVSSLARTAALKPTPNVLQPGPAAAPNTVTLVGVTRPNFVATSVQYETRVFHSPAASAAASAAAAAAAVPRAPDYVQQTSHAYLQPAASTNYVQRQADVVYARPASLAGLSGQSAAYPAAYVYAPQTADHVRVRTVLPTAVGPARLALVTSPSTPLPVGSSVSSSLLSSSSSSPVPAVIVRQRLAAGSSAGLAGITRVTPYLAGGEVALPHGVVYETQSTLEFAGGHQPFYRRARS